MKYLKNEAGYIKFIFILAFLALAGYIGFQVAVPYYRHSALNTDSVELARTTLGNEERLRDLIFERAQELNVPIKKEDITVERRSEDKMHVSMEWTEELNIFDSYRKTLHFRIDFVE